jgi:hypothetical protein
MPSAEERTSAQPPAPGPTRRRRDRTAQRCAVRSQTRSPSIQEGTSMVTSAHTKDLIVDERRADRFEALVGRAQPPPRPDDAPTAESSRPRDGHPSLGRSIVVATATAVPLVLATVAICLATTGTSLTSSLGIGAFAALWGGGGFGVMIGGVLYAHRADAGTPVPSLVGSEHDLSPALLPAWPSSTPVSGRRR